MKKNRKKLFSKTQQNKNEKIIKMKKNQKNLENTDSTQYTNGASASASTTTQEGQNNNSKEKEEEEEEDTKHAPKESSAKANDKDSGKKKKIKNKKDSSSLINKYDKLIECENLEQASKEFRTVLRLIARFREKSLNKHSGNEHDGIDLNILNNQALSLDELETASRMALQNMKFMFELSQLANEKNGDINSGSKSSKHGIDINTIINIKYRNKEKSNNHNRYGLCLFGLSQYKLAFIEFQKAAMLNNFENYNYLYNCGKALYFDLNYKESIRYFQKAIELSFGQIKIFRLWYALSLEKSNKLHESLIEYLTVINCIADPITAKEIRKQRKLKKYNNNNNIIDPITTTTTTATTTTNSQVPTVSQTAQSTQEQQHATTAVTAGATTTAASATTNTATAVASDSDRNAFSRLFFGSNTGVSKQEYVANIRQTNENLSKNKNNNNLTPTSTGRTRSISLTTNELRTNSAIGGNSTSEALTGHSGESNTFSFFNALGFTSNSNIHATANNLTSSSGATAAGVSSTAPITTSNGGGDRHASKSIDWNIFGIGHSSGKDYHHHHHHGMAGGMSADDKCVEMAKKRVPIVKYKLEKEFSKDVLFSTHNRQITKRTLFRDPSKLKVLRKGERTKSQMKLDLIKIIDKEKENEIEKDNDNARETENENENENESEIDSSSSDNGDSSSSSSSTEIELMSSSGDNDDDDDEEDGSESSNSSSDDDDNVDNNDNNDNEENESEIESGDSYNDDSENSQNSVKIVKTKGKGKRLDGGLKRHKSKDYIGDTHFLNTNFLDKGKKKRNKMEAVVDDDVLASVLNLPDISASIDSSNEMENDNDKGAQSKSMSMNSNSTSASEWQNVVDDDNDQDDQDETQLP